MDKSKYSKIIFVVSISIVVFLFIRGFYINKQSYKEFVNGRIIKMENGSKGSVILFLKNDTESKGYQRYVVGPSTIDDKLIVGDSIVKFSNSYMLYLYKKAGMVYHLDDSSEIYHW